MDFRLAIKALSDCSQEQKVRFVAMLCHDLTVVARDTYGSAGEVKDVLRLRAFNEILHRVTGFLVSIFDHDLDRYSDEAIAAVFFTSRDDKHLERLLTFAFERVCRSCAIDS